MRLGRVAVELGKKGGEMEFKLYGGEGDALV